MLPPGVTAAFKPDKGPGIEATWYLVYCQVLDGAELEDYLLTFVQKMMYLTPTTQLPHRPHCSYH